MRITHTDRTDELKEIEKSLPLSEQVYNVLNYEDYIIMVIVGDHVMVIG